MLKRDRRKIGISLILLAVAGIAIRLAFATVASEISVWLIGAGVLLILTSMFVFAIYFKE